MTLTLELPVEVQQVLEARARARGVSLPKYLQDLAARNARSGAAAALGSFAGNGHEVEDFLRERREEIGREEIGREDAQVLAPGAVREQLDAQLDRLRVRAEQRGHRQSQQPKEERRAA